MRVVHVPFTYHPDAVGGTEVYVAELARELAPLGIESVVAAPASGQAGARYDYDGVAVHRFPVAPSDDIRDVYGDGDARAAAALDAVVAEERADVIHLHAFTRAASVRAARAAHSRGVPVVFTYHTPTASCVRGTLLRDGRDPCDGALVERRCAACLLESHGVPKPARTAIAAMPSRLGAALAAAGARGRWVTALRARELTGVRHDAFRTLLREADAVVAVCEWVRAMLLRAGADPKRLVLSRQGTPAGASVRHRAVESHGPLRLAYVGRLHPTKGLHVVLAALADRRELAVALDVYGVVQDAAGERYAEELRRLAGTDERVAFRPAVSANHVVSTLAAYHATVAPSQWLETGPLTVLESFAAGVPVLGSNLGGIAELVTHDRDGWLVSHASTAAWAAALARLATDRSLCARLRAGVRPPRTTADVARDMARLYESIVPRAARPAYAAAGRAH